jgi:hypothetical protein
MRRKILWLSLLCATACVAACGGGQPNANSAASDERPELKAENIRQDINGRWVKVPAADGKSKPLDPWIFDEREPKQIEVVEQKIEGDRATFLVNMQTRTVPRSRNPMSLSGQLRLHYELQSGLIFRAWEITDVENVSFTYVKETPPPDANANDNANGGMNSNGNTNAKPKANDNAKANENSPRNNSGDDQ